MMESNQSKHKKSWYRKWWGIILIIPIWPYFLIWYVWARTKLPTLAKVLLTFVLAAVILTTAIVSLIVLVSILAGNNSSSDKYMSDYENWKPDSSQQSTTPTPTPAAPAPTPQPTKAQLVSDWFSKYDGVINTYNSDFDQINKDAGNSDTPAVGNDCQKLSADVATAQQVPAIPDAQSASDFSSALTYYQSGATQCVAAANNDDNQGLIDSAALLSKGNDKIKATISDIQTAKNQ